MCEFENDPKELASWQLDQIINDGDDLCNLVSALSVREYGVEGWVSNQISWPYLKR